MKDQRDIELWRRFAFDQAFRREVCEHSEVVQNQELGKAITLFKEHRALVARSCPEPLTQSALLYLRSRW